jgi:hypothetical protein
LARADSTSGLAAQQFHRRWIRIRAGAEISATKVADPAERDSNSGK